MVVALVAVIVVVAPSLAAATPRVSPSLSSHIRADTARAHVRRAGARPPRCVWIAQARTHALSPRRLANEVLARMTLAEKAGLAVLRASGGYENLTSAVPRLCLPSLTLQDGPNGVAYGATGVTQLPSSLGVAASFDPSLARAYGEVEGAEARGKGIDVVQGPNLNLMRVPTSGRGFEGYGEDPYLASVMGVADIRGIQSEGVLADAKHFTAYNQETARLILREDVARRPLEELYLAPFRAAVRTGHVASIMCSYGALNGANDCSDPSLYATLRSWGFTGFVRSDLAAVFNPVTAFRAGIDLVKPMRASTLAALVRRGRISVADLDRAVRSTLTAMFRFGLVAHPRAPTISKDVATPAHARLALRAAEESMVLLKDQGVTLPLRLGGSLAVIGPAAAVRPVTAGSGSAYVVPPFVVTPLAAIEGRVRRGVHVLYAAGMPPDRVLPPILAADLSSGTPLASRAPPARAEEPGKADIGLLGKPSVTAAIATALRPGRGSEWSSWHATLAPPRTGLYEISVEQNGDTWAYLDHRPLLSFPGLHGRSSWSTTVPLVSGQRYPIALRWFAIDGAHDPRIGWQYVTPLIHAAVVAARRSRTAVVFVNDYSGEGADRPSLSLPGDENALVSAVAAANPRTVVVLNTGGPVLMPWLSSVSAVLEAWYPGEEDGSATANVLFGRVDPSGRLPVTFPASGDATPVASPSSFPGISSVVHYSEGLDIGYRWYAAHRVAPLFPFGFGLSYTTFALSHLAAARAGTGEAVSVEVANTGRERGTDVIEAYVGFPRSAGEPPRQLAAFTRVVLGAGRSETARLELAHRAFEAYRGHGFETVSGSYTLTVAASATDPGMRVVVRAP
ncbi:MAG TPA: glycoside hydrolase family 3 C-terminal domain-containing protein [Acidimicrobiales bacterium]|nr:glycoside hydrolase family 3 C-terminal domain-containing protein [Acidimicrobiales bacterium]